MVCENIPILRVVVMFDPTPELPDQTPTDQVLFPTRIRNALVNAGLRTVGDLHGTPDKTLLSFPDIGNESVAYIREMLGLPSTDGVRPRHEANGMMLGDMAP